MVFTRKEEIFMGELLVSGRVKNSMKIGGAILVNPGESKCWFFQVEYVVIPASYQLGGLTPKVITTLSLTIYQVHDTFTCWI